MPNKIVLPFYKDKSIVELIIEKLKELDCVIIVATSNNEEDDIFELIAEKYNVSFFRGSENDVLNRFISAADMFSVTKILRICSDNPFLDSEDIQKLVEYSAQTYDYVGFKINGEPAIKTHYGFWAEYITLKALKMVENLTDESKFHEHVTNYIYTFPEKFNIKWIERELENDGIRLTVDTPEDFNYTSEIYGKMIQMDINFKYKDVIAFLSLNNHYVESMKDSIIKNTK